MNMQIKNITNSKVINQAKEILNKYLSKQKKYKKVVSKKGTFKTLNVGRRYRLIASLVSDTWILMTHESYNRYVQ